MTTQRIHILRGVVLGVGHEDGLEGSEHTVPTPLARVLVNNRQARIVEAPTEPKAPTAEEQKAKDEAEAKIKASADKDKK